ncbi:hypothetical protein [Vibrio aerogenes]|uniref:hypothetical protein n=1 Tax=Vibrio aerogenes TaxID=92172 RepID=UPI0021C4B5FE|nr:hypothetical protein [Vibrio aerogenes]
MADDNRVDMSSLVKQLTVEEIEEIREAVHSLDETIRQIPKELDGSFQSKINRILDITSDVEAQSRALRKQSELNQQGEFSPQLNTALNEISQQLEIISAQSIQTSPHDISKMIMTSLFSASLTAVIFYLLVIWL